MEEESTTERVLLLGHKSIMNTLLYVQLAEELFKDELDFISKVAKTEAEICSLVGGIYWWWWIFGAVSTLLAALAWIF